MALTAALKNKSSASKMRSARYVQVVLDAAGDRIAGVHFQPWRAGHTMDDFFTALAADRDRADAEDQPGWAAAFDLLHAALDPAGGFDPAQAERRLAWPTGARRCQILKRLLRVPFGQTVTYGELARQVTPPSGPRAVGQTMNKNPFPVIVPCHRVVAAGGALGGFGGGLDWKRALLGWEGSLPAAPGEHA